MSKSDYYALAIASMIVNASLSFIFCAMLKSHVEIRLEQIRNELVVPPQNIYYFKATPPEEKWENVPRIDDSYKHST